MIEIDVKNLQRKHPVDRERTRALAVRALEAAGYEDAQVSIVMVSDRRMRAMNRAYRGLDRTTDVLAFSQVEGEGAGAHPEVLGDVVVSVESAARQAVEAGWSLGEELNLLVVHGMLHLAGYDHVRDPSAKAEMERMAAKILGRSGK